ncbi:retrovirus-related Pol polyprotein from type-1 retrotransposable element R2 [Caerostris darwini]|uniref:Retrovirus-related Pol polyprotein from type-1 retrotransposable element R2 n=1 Tax=Caerostris darwini TaxID=1538125 RepID=A0AAV4TG93_9ARAC|nr:retrovirus-related Pol polyprotein from type-1 retrotransposable element R2 [Caerostris darwini]
MAFHASFSKTSPFAQIIERGFSTPFVTAYDHKGHRPNQQKESRKGNGGDCSGATSYPGRHCDLPDDSVGGPISHFLEQLDAFLADQVPTDAFYSFENLVDEIVQTAVSHLFPDGPPPSGSGSSPVEINIDDPATCQQLYTRNRRRAVREITGNSGFRCKIPLDSLVQHFSNCWSAGDSDLSFCLAPSLPRVESLFWIRISPPPEVWDILKKAENTAPGPDRLTFSFTDGRSRCSGFDQIVQYLCSVPSGPRTLEAFHYHPDPQGRRSGTNLELATHSFIVHCI